MSDFDSTDLNKFNLGHLTDPNHPADDPSHNFSFDRGYIQAPLLIVRDTVVFPRILSPIVAMRDSSQAAVEEANMSDGDLIVITQHDPLEEDPGPHDVYQVGVSASIVRHLRMPEGATNILLQGQERVEIVEWLQRRPFPIVKARILFEPEIDSLSLAIEAQMRAVLTLFEKCVQLHSHIPEDALIAANNVEHPGWLADLIASILEVEVRHRQEILDLVDPGLRLQRLATILARELDVLELENRIHNQVQQEVDKSQREYFLREQIRVMQNELGEADGSLSEIGELTQRLDQLEVSEEVRLKTEKEIRRLKDIPAMAPEVGIIRTYVDWILDLPWSVYSQDNLDINHAEAVLDKNHYGLPLVKERILEYMAVRARNLKAGRSNVRTPLLCFVGPPGTGKTSLGQSIAEALGRKFARISLGGLRDEAEIRGHRRTYIGALPGRIIQTMKRAGTINPLIMLDEIDKVGTDYRGDPTAALLEVLDPEQNATFFDHYLDLPYDLSQVLFITTANLRDTIPPPLADRMEMIEFSGYIDQEKQAIAKQFLIPRHLEEHNLEAADLSFSDRAIQQVIRQYTYEAGVRNLDRELGRVCRKVVRRLEQGRNVPKTITPRALSRFLGPPRFTDNMLGKIDAVGISHGLAWTQAGGDVLSIEVNLFEGTGKLILTGKLGEVMQESAQAALSYTKAKAKQFQIDPARFEKTDIHIHIPEGATPKDGPSAGIALATALVSAFAERKVKHDVAMTGEVTLRGRVLPIGGLKVKAIAAHRAGIDTVIIPKQNQKDLPEIPAKVRRTIQFVLVESMDKALETALDVQVE